MQEQRGLPIAAHLGLLVALAFVSAFIGIVAVVIWLPPRPPDVMRADTVAEHFQDGYALMRRSGHPPDSDRMRWSIAAMPPSSDLVSPHMSHIRHLLAQRLALRPEQVRLGASHFVRNDVFVFRVQGEDDFSVERNGIVIQRRTPQPGAPVAAPPAPHARTGARTPAPPPAPAPPAAHEGDEMFEMRLPDEAPPPPTPPAAAIPPAPPLFAPAPEGVALISGFEFSAQLPDGRWLTMRQGRNWAELGWIGRAALIIAAALAVLSLLALMFARRMAQPIQHFADAVQAVGVNPQSAPVLEEGPRELRGAARAVNAMQARLRALIADRTKTLAAVAHDMRTPLMRLRLAAENAPAEQRDRIAKEINEVEALVASFIAFARDDPAEEARVRVDLSALLQSVVDDQVAAGHAVVFSGEDRFVLTGQSLGLKRLFSNLIDNAFKHGGDVRVTLRREAGQAVVDVDDDGPGIPADQRETVFQPFVRLNGDAPGAGLGLPTARSIARAHGGDVVILDAESGARVRVTLPA